MESARHPLEILPDVVWREVIKNFSSADSRRCYNSCTYFRDLLKPSIFCWNFREVLPLILGKGKESFGYLRFRLSKTDMFNCRLVCESWRTAMDDWSLNLQETSEAQNFLIHFHKEQHIDRLLTDMTHYRFSNFMWKNIQLGVRNAEEGFGDPFPPLTDEALDAYWEKCYALLQEVGMHVTRILIEGIEDYTPDGGLKFTKQVRRCLTLLPKVKELNIANNQLFDLNWGDDFQHEMNEIEEYLTNNPLPHLPRLKSLVMQKTFGALPASLIKHLTTTYGPQLESMTAWTINDIPAQYNFQILGNLKKLDIETYDAEETVSNSLNFLGNLNCPFLETLRLDIEGPNEPMSVVNFLEKIQNLPLKHLDMQLSLSYEERIPDSIRFITTKSLSLTVDSRLETREREVSFNFLQCFSNLENLEFTWWHEPNGLPLLGDERNIRLNEYFNSDGSLYHSNVWNVLPKLERLTFRRIRAIRFQNEGDLDQIRIYTRRQYQLSQ